jgi:hypothetical protein
MVKTTLYLPEELRQQLHAIARQTGRSWADVVREELATFVGRYECRRPASIGIIDDPGLTGDGIQAWLRHARDAT